MQITSPIKIGAHDIHIQLAEPDLLPDGLMGQSNPAFHVIKLADCFPKSQIEETLCHEIIENINANYELNMEHRVIQVLGTVIYQVLHDNRLKFF